MREFFRAPGTCLAACVLVCCIGVTAAAQPMARGVVLDVTGATVPGATVSVSVAGRVVAELATAADGTFALGDLPAGEVLITVSAPGFAPVSRQLPQPIAADALEFVVQAAGLAEVVTVTATRGVEQLAAVASASVLTSTQLAIVAAPTIDDALRATPGFSLFRRSSSRVANPSTQGVTLRGLAGSGASRTLVLADGSPLNDPFGSWVYWNRIPQAAVDRIEVVRGASGDLYAADALGGVIQVLTLPPTRTYLRALSEGGSRDTWRASGFGAAMHRGWHASAAGEWLDTDGAYVVAPADRGRVDVPAWSDYEAVMATAGREAAGWRALARMNLYSEVRGNGTALVGNDTNAHQYSGEVSGAAGQQTWLVRGGGGTQRYFNNFSAVSADRNSERRTSEQRVPLDSGSGTAQWTLTRGATALLAGGEMRRTDAEVHEIRYSLTGVPSGPFVTGGTETVGAVFVRASSVLRNDLTIVAGARGDFWRSTPLLPESPRHAVNFFSPRASIAWQARQALTVHGSVYRAYRSPTLNELHRSFRVGNVFTEGNPLLQPERLTGGEAGALLAGSRYSARATYFFNHLDDVVTNVTLQTTPTLITRQKQNADTVRAMGIEAEVDVRPTSTLTLTGLAVWTDSTFRSSAAQPALAGNRVPQVPSYQFGAGLAWADPRWVTATLQLRTIGEQYDDDRNTFLLDGFTVVDAYVGRSLGRRVQVYAAVENLGDVVYDTGRTPVRTIGWPRTVRAGVRLQLP
jgi:outer membrane receptor protein involved in Fe transport